ncbi:glycosyltransferase family 2 protein [Effusibacillus dendaii]|uniref:Glycosyl transferase family 2 n=1 Tax=Effusibacillus dendaii TaxID=2743772 RepID=A0A7I8D8G6_9BACL|nr:glycosyltransferase family 2 protein [Effusibacillus dendaii]BCJ86414.1 glycosyl transferase family 2 [Effusibacillus dendaii]
MNRDTLIIIPAYNEEKSIAQVIRSILRYTPDADIVVVNDGSTDNTAQVAGQAGAIVLNLPFNVGIGGGMQTGYLYAHEKGYRYAVQIDADGQHDPADLPRLLQHAKNGEADMILGSRYIAKTSYKSSAMRRVGMIFFSKLVFLLTGQEVKDTTSGYRVVNKNLIDLFSRSYPTDYPEVEVIVFLKRHGYSLLEVPTEMHQRQAGVSSITPFKSVYYIVKVALALIMNVLRHRKARELS